MNPAFSTPFSRQATFFIRLGASLGALLILASGWPMRASLPPCPLWDPDTWGYLNPALSWFNGQAFQQTDGRQVLYPSLLLLPLFQGQGFAGIAYAQQLVGVLSALLFWGIWLLWWNLLPSSRVRDVVLPWPGLVALALYSWNPSTVFYELSLRPESIFAAFGLAQLACAVVFLRGAFHASRSRTILIAAGALSLFLAFCCFRLKPSWAFAMMFTSLPVAAAIAFATSRRKEALAAAALGFLAIAGMSAAYKSWMVPDSASTRFLPTTLFTIHADLIAARMAGSTDGDPWEKSFRDNLESELAIARSNPGTYTVLGFDPDYLMYRSSLGMPLLEAGLSDKDIERFYYRSYRDAWLSNPAGMVRKILRQLTTFLVPDRDTFLTNKKDFLTAYARSAPIAEKATMTEPGPASALLEAHAEAARVAGSKAHVLRAPNWLRPAASTVAVLALPVTALFLVTFLLRGRRELLLPGFVALLFYSAPFGNALTVSVIHALDIDRYRQTYGVFFSLALAAMLTYVLVAWLTSKSSCPK